MSIPATKFSPGKWGEMKVFRYIDSYKLDNHNLAPITGEDEMVSMNQRIRDCIKKSTGDTVTVTLYLQSDYLYEEYGY
ncbi:DUF1905 domain-containing protein [Fundicoccus ignavus]|uniref:DUF1905 domain-containing protein n=1 Tax=Fundicoccus ignavus TaxID=2664442 RepID=UPI002484223F|nr:DUF1905 domain-containing protein [Fundicoccus ignavus]